MAADAIADPEAGRLLCFWLPLRSGLRALPWLVLTICNILGRAFGAHRAQIDELDKVMGVRLLVELGQLIQRVLRCARVIWLIGLAVSSLIAVAAEPVESRGSGGAIGSYELVLPTPGFETDPRFGSKTLIVYSPSQAHAGPARPLILLLHGTAGSPFAAIQQARNVRTFWQPVAEAEQIVLVAPSASGPSGGWLAPITSSDRPTDYDAMAAALDFAAARYNINLRLVYVWGFSSGGHVALDLGLNRIHPQLNRDRFAAFAANAGVMEGLACPPNDAIACAAVAAGTPAFPLSVAIGETDPLFPRVVADYKRLVGAGWSIRAGTYRSTRFAGGHTVLSEHPDWHWQNLRQWARSVAKAPEAEPIVSSAPSAPGLERPLQGPENKDN